MTKDSIREPRAILLHPSLAPRNVEACQDRPLDPGKEALGFAHDARQARGLNGAHAAFEPSPKDATMACDGSVPARQRPQEGGGTSTERALHER